MSKVVELKGSVLSLTVLKLYSDQIKEVKKQLEQKVQQAPDFFNGLPVVIEPQLDQLDPTFLALLVEFLHQKNMVPIGVRTDVSAIAEQAQFSGLAVFAPGTKPQESALDTQLSASAIGALVHQGAVRSGQQVYAQARDLIVKGTVNPGAEIVADGHVHVYGTIKGKVFAGASGNSDARIYVQNLDAEMVCIAGLYQVADDIKPEYKLGWVEIKLENERLVFSKLV